MLRLYIIVRYRYLFTCLECLLYYWDNLEESHIELLILVLKDSLVNETVTLQLLKNFMDVNYFWINLVSISLDRNDSIRIKSVLILFHIFHAGIVKLITYKKVSFFVILIKDNKIPYPNLNNLLHKNVDVKD